MRNLKSKIFTGNIVIFLVLIILCLFFSVMNPKAFLTMDNFFVVMRQVSMLGITAVGMTLVMIVGGFDLSVGTLQGLVGAAVGSFMVTYGLPIWVSIILTIIVGILIGTINGLIVTRLKVNPFITTLSTMTIIKGVAFAYTGAYPVYGFDESFKMLGQGYLFGIIPIPVVIMFIVFGIGMFILNKTYIGRNLYAVGGNEEATRLSGINVKNAKLISFIICSAFASLAGIILASRLNSGQPAAGSGFEFDVITACVLGGISLDGGEGKLTGVLFGVLIIGVLGNGMIILSIDEYYQWIIKGLVMIAAVAMDGIKTINTRKPKKQIA